MHADVGDRGDCCMAYAENARVQVDVQTFRKRITYSRTANAYDRTSVGLIDGGGKAKK